jgi:hypothetical protein
MEEHLNLDNLDQRSIILIYSYKKWLNDEEIYDNNRIISPIIILCMFKKYLNSNSYNLFLSKELLQYFNDYIDKKSRYFYLAIKYKKKWIHNYINRKEPINLCDLELTPINSSKYYINYIDYKERKRYLFTIKDFKKIVSSSLEHCYSYDLLPEPIPIKNPYTNKEFTPSELDYINKNLYDMPLVWNMFVDSKYNIYTLKTKYNYYLLPLCIPSYVDQFGEIDIIDYLVDLFDTYDINYCEQCLYRDRKDIHTEKVKNILIEWVKCSTFNKIMSRKSIDEVKYIYGLLYCPHNVPNNVPNNVRHIKNEENKENFILYNLDFTKPLFCTGYKGKDDKKIYLKKKREINTKLYRKSMKNKLKLKE